MVEDLSIFLDNIRINVRVGILLKYQDMVVIEKPDTEDFYVIPGGRVKIMEHSRAAIAREVKEEMNFDLEDIKLKQVSCIENFYSYLNYEHHELYFVYNYELSKKEAEFIKNNSRNKDNNNSTFVFIKTAEAKNYKILPEKLLEFMK